MRKNPIMKNFKCIISYRFLCFSVRSTAESLTLNNWHKHMIPILIYLYPGLRKLPILVFYVLWR